VSDGAIDARSAAGFEGDLAQVAMRYRVALAGLAAFWNIAVALVKRFCS
jgi:hypothetical protein